MRRRQAHQLSQLKSASQAVSDQMRQSGLLRDEAVAQAVAEVRREEEVTAARREEEWRSEELRLRCALKQAYRPLGCVVGLLA